MNKQPKRCDAIYKEIESFKEYELTQCVAYAMAIRNDEVIKLKSAINTLLKIIKDEFIDCRDNDRKFNDDFDLLQAKYDEQYYDDNIDNDELDIPDYYKYFIEQNENAKTISRNLKILIDKYWIRYFFEKDIIYEAFGNIEEYEYSKQEAKIREHGLIAPLSVIGNSKDGRVIYSEDIKFAFGGYDDKCKQIDINKVLISQKIDSLVIPKKYDISINVKINLALPESELMAYIKQLKNNYDTDNGMIKSSAKLLLGDELQKADNLVCDSKGKCFDSRTILSKSQKLADMFYIYDALKIGMKQRKIQNETYNYYADIGIESITLDPKTLKKYKELAIDYIDNMRYKELITGIKI